MRHWILTTLMMMACVPALAETPRALQWQGTPLSIVLTPDQETILEVGDDVRVATPAFLSKLLSVTSLSGRIYLTANSPFESARIQLERLSDGLRIFVDLSARESAQTPAKIAITLPNQAAQQQATLVNETARHLAQTKMAPEALLVRYAMQSLYSPSHALEPLPGVSRAPMGLPNDIASRAFARWNVKAEPIAAWQLNGKVVTAIKLTNLSTRNEVLDPRWVTLSGQCLVRACYVSFSHPDLNKAGSASAIATAFLVTPGALSAHLLPEVSHD